MTPAARSSVWASSAPAGRDRPSGTPLAMRVPMSFREVVFSRADGRCECDQPFCCDHQGRCTRRLYGDSWYLVPHDEADPESPGSLVGLCAICYARWVAYMPLSRR